MTVTQQANTNNNTQANRVMDLGGEATYTFQFATPLPTAYNYFMDIPSVFRLLPDMLEIKPYAQDRYRLVVGATDGYGHTMASIFDLRAECHDNTSIHIMPTNDGPSVHMEGLVFPGSLWADATFRPSNHGTVVDYRVELAMSIPIPGMLRMMPMPFLQGVGERGMAYKMSQMIHGFAQDINKDFAQWMARS